ncbi:substrate-binding domain-containing protein [Tetragenococcus halophilus]|uniref:Substrate-binding domain-containing protein n=5 Tax=Tetragenococcus TaxID=51668 RepID=A0AB35HRV1_TETHA|nr:substrate-binding domain-containing protein [Tetragenococcus halophilus]MCO8283967.1 substrate-binding domain-containing protein [Tetragenococcus halophilus]MCO8286292.1 substrate-binding domain-containing protein [Tetragenococcus halophilus]MCO8289020.1 substrate-binding domain-containing protein [Tetragenococcus halophilus]MCO8291081.1 substrate-binding domain-containing protein [Tetragenococcus halophilus]MCO8294172.1 substrate-binding domain-containing protein [Tetragenococcus halophilu
MHRPKKRELIDQLFTGETGYDGIFAGDDIIATMCMNSAKEHGVSVPAELKIIGFDGTKIVRQLNPELTTIVQPIEKLAQKSVEVLLALLNEEKVEQVTKLPVNLLSSTSSQ